MSILICGSIAYDNIMVFPGRFRDHILPEQIHILNVSFLVPELRREFGGCAGNIAYNLKLLGSEPLVMGTVGDDSLLYFERLERLGIKLDCVRQVPGTLTAQAFITTDLDDNQITAFHPGAMNFSHQNNIARELGAELAIVAPDGRDGMLQHARELADLGIPFMFDPGQGLPMFSGKELLALIEHATYLALNDYEGRLLEERTGRKLEEFAPGLEALVLTRGAEGSIIYANGQRIDIPCAEAEAVVDPTGCGDAYRAGLLYGIASGFDWEKTG
ncbi:MAG TPA: carbohydrate kinase family protein, partial [Burkholderiales bacterium]|nr:carbohydrate kinase family protein [Burkholderiales bacterium]